MDSPATIEFFATGFRRSMGGIASANRNIYEGLNEVAAEYGARVRTHVLHEPVMSSYLERAYAGAKYRFAFELVFAAPRAVLFVFDHVGLARPILFLPRAIRPPIVICAHGSESWKRVTRTSINIFRSADLVLTNSNYTLEKMRDRFNDFAGVACPLGLSPQFRLNQSPPQREITRSVLRAADGYCRPIGSRAMLLVGRMDARERQKGHREMLNVFPAVAKKIPGAQLIFAGGGDDFAALHDLARSSSFAARIFLPGPVDDSLLADLYSSAYAYVMPSRQEGFGLVYLEAMNYALPCVGCRMDGAADVVVDGETGYLVDQPVNEAQLVDILVRLLSDAECARRFGEAGWRRLHECFTADAHKARVRTLVSPLLRRRGSAFPRTLT